MHLYVYTYSPTTHPHIHTKAAASGRQAADIHVYMQADAYTQIDASNPRGVELAGSVVMLGGGDVAGRCGGGSAAACVSDALPIGAAVYAEGWMACLCVFVCVCA